MSGFDELYASAIARSKLVDDTDPTSLGPLETFDLKRIGAALDRARMNEGQPVPEHYLLPDYIGSAARLRFDGDEVGSHGLTLLDGDTCYVADVAVDAPRTIFPLSIARRGWWRDAGLERDAQISFGDERPLGLHAFDRSYVVRCRSPEQAIAFLQEDVVTTLEGVRRDLVVVRVEPQDGRLLVRVVTRVDGPQDAVPSIALARAVYASSRILAERPHGFVAAGRARVDVAPEHLRALVEQVRDATTFAAGVVERVGDGIEARLELDRPEGLKGSLRIEPRAAGTVATYFVGELLSPPTSKAKLGPERGVIGRARGLLDPKVGDAQLDSAFLIEGAVDAARIALADPNAALRLAGRDAIITVDGTGLSVNVERLPDEDAALLEVIVACLSSWREAAIKNAGLVWSERP